LTAVSAGCPALKTMRLSRCGKISDRGVEALSKLRGLRTLDLSQSHREESKVTDRGIDALRAATALVSLNVHMCRAVSDGAVERLRKINRGLQCRGSRLP
jgi:hypothetical protein